MTPEETRAALQQLLDSTSKEVALLASLLLDLTDKAATTAKDAVEAPSTTPEDEPAA